MVVSHLHWRVASDVSSLFTLQAVATASRPYPCLHPKCKKSFTKGSDLKRHEKLHLPKEELDAVYANFSLLPLLDVADFPGQ